MSFFKDFKAFAIKGNMFDLAVGVVIGAAFGKIINSLVSDLIMPPFGYALSGVDFKKLKWVLKPAVLDAKTGAIVTPEAAITYGNAIQVTIEFFIIAFCIFLFVQMIHRMRKKDEAEKAAAPPPPPGEEIILLREIRDNLKKQ
jgi:large conductance mechanosensitive channel